MLATLLQLVPELSTGAELSWSFTRGTDFTSCFSGPIPLPPSYSLSLASAEARRTSGKSLEKVYRVPVGSPGSIASRGLAGAAFPIIWNTWSSLGPGGEARLGMEKEQKIPLLKCYALMWQQHLAWEPELLLPLVCVGLREPSKLYSSPTLSPNISQWRPQISDGDRGHRADSLYEGENGMRVERLPGLRCCIQGSAPMADVISSRHPEKTQEGVIRFSALMFPEDHKPFV